MKLSRVEIKNFRSIKKVDVHFDPTCRILVGINESGKSNILRALSLLDPLQPVDAADIRFLSPDEAVGEESHVWFVFLLTEPERSEDLLRHKVRTGRIRSCSPPLNSKNDPQRSNA